MPVDQQHSAVYTENPAAHSSAGMPVGLDDRCSKFRSNVLRNLCIDAASGQRSISLHERRCYFGHCFGGYFALS